MLKKVIMFLSAMIVCGANAQSINPPQLPPPPPHIAAKAFYLVDVNTGAVLASKKEDKQLAPASLTKLMTLYLTFDALKSGQAKLNDKALVSTKAWKMPGSRMFLKPGSNVTIDQLIRGVIVDSGNDACVTLGEHFGGTETGFVAMMNQTAKQLGMNHTHYVDTTGLPSRLHYSSAKDLATLTRALISQFPEYYPYFSQKWFRYNKIKQPNRNRLLWRDHSVDGLKTGHTDSAGYCLVSSAKRHNMRLISVVMGTRSDIARSNESQKLLNYGYRFYKTHELFKGNQPLNSVRVWMGKNTNVPLGLNEPLYVTIRNGDYSKLKANMSLTPSVKAPVKVGQTMGHIVVTLNNKPIKTVNLVALKADPLGPWFSRNLDRVKLTFHHFFN